MLSRSREKTSSLINAARKEKEIYIYILADYYSFCPIIGTNRMANRGAIYIERRKRSEKIPSTAVRGAFVCDLYRCNISKAPRRFINAYIHIYRLFVPRWISKSFQPHIYNFPHPACATCVCEKYMYFKTFLCTASSSPAFFHYIAIYTSHSRHLQKRAAKHFRETTLSLCACMYAELTHIYIPERKYERKEKDSERFFTVGTIKSDLVTHI